LINLYWLIPGRGYFFIRYSLWRTKIRNALQYIADHQPEYWNRNPPPWKCGSDSTRSLRRKSRSKAILRLASIIDQIDWQLMKEAYEEW